MYLEYKKQPTKQQLQEIEPFPGVGILIPTPPDIEGPFYLAGAPFRSTLCDNPTLHLFGKVVDIYNQPLGPLAKVLFDFWQADSNGIYDEKGFNFRGKVAALFDDRGNTYRLNTIRPGDYQISDTEFRCSHIHVKVTAIGYKSLTTQLYFKDDKYNQTDHWFNKRRIIGDDGRFDFVLEKE